MAEGLTFERIWKHLDDNNVPRFLKKEQFRWYYDIAQEAPQESAIELGCWCGASTAIWVGCFMRVTAIDRFNGTWYNKHFQDQLNVNESYKQCLLSHIYNLDQDTIIDIYEADTQDPKSIKLAPANSSFLFIDDDHSEVGVRTTTKHFLPRLAKGGVVVVDNYNDACNNPGEEFINKTAVGLAFHQETHKLGIRLEEIDIVDWAGAFRRIE